MVNMQPTYAELSLTAGEESELRENGFDSEEAILRAVTPDLIGPTWAKDEEGEWLLPERTLGWQIAVWCGNYLLAKDGGPWVFTLEQLRFLLWWYAVDENGRFTYRTGVLQRMKGWGKDPLLAVICLVEFAGPSRFSHWGEDGNPVGVAVRAPYVQIAAVNLEQTRNTMDLIPDLMSEDFKVEYGVKLGIERIRGRVGTSMAQIVAATSSPRALEGKRTTFTLLNETHHWIAGNQGHAMYETIDGNATKVRGRYLSITNAYFPGEDSVAERMRSAYEAALEKGDTGDFLYDSVEAHPSAPLGGPLLPRILERMRGDAIWLDIPNMVSSIKNRVNTPQRSRRMWLNQIVSGSEGLHSEESWRSILNEELRDLSEKEGTLAGLYDGDEVVIGFDGSKSEDATAIVVIKVSTRTAYVYGLWEAPMVTTSAADERWEVNREEVDSAIHEVFSRFKVKAFFADVAQWESYIEKWSVEYGPLLEVDALQGKPIAWDMRTSLKESTMAHERLLDAIESKSIWHIGDRRLRRHMLNTHRRENRYGVSFGKVTRGSRRKIDIYAALMLGHEALLKYEQKSSKDNAKKKKRTGRGYFL